MHRTATALLLRSPGRYRKTQVHLQDVDGLRRLGLADDLPDAQKLDDAAVADVAFARRREKTGGDFLPLHQHRIVAIACLFRDDDGVREGGPRAGRQHVGGERD